jgi:phage portal protein BeeE
VGQALAAQRYGSAFFGDSAIPSMALVSDQSLTQQQAQITRDIWEFSHKGRRGTAVFGNGLKPVPLNVPPEASQFLDTQRFSVQQVCRYFGVPPEMIGADSGSPKTYANLEQRNLDFLTYGVGPKIVRLEHTLNASLPRGQFVKFNTGALLRRARPDRIRRAETVGQALAAQRYGSAFFGDSAIPSMALVSDRDQQPARCLRALQHRDEPGLQTAWRVLQREVDHVALLDGHAAKGDPAERNGHPEVEPEPALAELRRSTEEGEPFGDDARHGPSGLRERRRQQLGGAPRGPAVH